MSATQPTTEEVINALSIATIEIAEGRISKFREGDKSGEFHQLNHLTQSMVNVQKASGTIDDAAASAGGGDGTSSGVAVGFVK